MMPRGLQLGQKPAHLLGQRARLPQVKRLLPARLAISQTVVGAKPPAASHAPGGDYASLAGKQFAAGEDVGADGVEGLHRSVQL
ncbi:MAG: hypothetical protein ACYC35_02985 [Pirellulales bacterium]